jgi:hypothetical protein
MAHYAVTTDFLYLKPAENGLSFAVFKGGKAKNPDFAWDPGFKVAGGYFFARDLWSVHLSFMHYHARITDWYAEQALPIWKRLAPPNEPFADCVRNRWRLHMGLADLTLKRCWQTSAFFQIAPFVGVRYAEIRQKTRINYFFAEEQDEIDMKNKFFGFGPIAGLALSWDLSHFISLYFNGAATFPYGFLYVHQDERTSLVQDELLFFRTFHSLRPITEFALGLRFVRCFLRLHFDIHAGYTLFFLWGQNQFTRFLDQVPNGNCFTNGGDLTLQGFNIGLTLRF